MSKSDLGHGARLVTKHARHCAIGGSQYGLKGLFPHFIVGYPTSI